MMMDGNFRYTRKEGLRTKTVGAVPAQRTDSENQFLQRFEKCYRPGFFLYAILKIQSEIGSVQLLDLFVDFILGYETLIRLSML